MTKEEIENDHDYDEDNFQPCDDCDLPDACNDFGCAIKQGIKKNPHNYTFGNRPNVPSNNIKRK